MQRLRTALEIHNERPWSSALVMSNRLGTIQEIVDVDLPPPARSRFAWLSGETRDRVFRLMGMSLRVGETAAA